MLKETFFNSTLRAAMKSLWSTCFSNRQDYFASKTKNKAKRRVSSFSFNRVPGALAVVSNHSKEINVTRFEKVEIELLYFQMI